MSESITFGRGLSNRAVSRRSDHCGFRSGAGRPTCRRASPGTARRKVSIIFSIF